MENILDVGVFDDQNITEIRDYFREVKDPEDYIRLDFRSDIEPIISDSERYDVYLLDLVMKGSIEDSYKLIRTLRLKYPQCYIIIISGKISDSNIRDKCFEAGANEVYKKKDLVEVINLCYEYFKKIYLCKVILNEQPIVLKYDGVVVEKIGKKIHLVVNNNLETKFENKKDLWFEQDRISDGNLLKTNDYVEMKDIIYNEKFSMLLIEKSKRIKKRAKKKYKEMIKNNSIDSLFKDVNNG